MLVIVSDLHLNDQTTGSPLNPGALEVFAERLNDLAIRASWRADGSYRPIDRLELLLLGDVLDTLHTTRWNEGEIRPWDDRTSPVVAEALNSIVDGILQRNRDHCAVLRAISRDGAIRVPAATMSGQPAVAEEALPVPVRTFYMVGNRDWMLHLPGAQYDTIRQKITHHLGLVNLYNAPFPHDPYESDELLAVLRRHRVFARHGDIFDPINFSEDRDASGLGDAIVIELLTRFAVTIGQQFGDDLPPAVVRELEDLDNIRPLLFAPVWMEGLLERSGTRPPVRKEIRWTWDSLVDRFLALSIVRDHDTWSPFDVVDGLERSLKFSKRLSIGWASKIAQWLQGMRGSESDSYYEHALAEQDFRNRRARHIVYGHTHQAESVPLDASYADGYVLNQMYFNAGTFRRVLRPTRSRASEYEFIPAENLSFLAFYHGDERGGCPFETWSGTLATAGTVATHRVDAGQTSHAAKQSLPASSVPVRPPHFRRSAAPAHNPARNAF